MSVLFSRRRDQTTRAIGAFLVVINQSGPACHQQACGKGSLAIYAPDAQGDDAPRQVIAEGIAEPGAVAAFTDGSIYVANQSSMDCSPGFCESFGPSSIRVYAMRRKGHFALRATIRGNNTGLDLPSFPYGIALDSSGNIYTLSTDTYDYSGAADQILIFPRGAKGYVAPPLAVFGSWAYGPVALALAPAIAP